MPSKAQHAWLKLSKPHGPRTCSNAGGQPYTLQTQPRSQRMQPWGNLSDPATAANGPDLAQVAAPLHDAATPITADPG